MNYEMRRLSEFVAQVGGHDTSGPKGAESDINDDAAFGRPARGIVATRASASLLTTDLS
jgi:hypothetical protein